MSHFKDNLGKIAGVRMVDAPAEAGEKTTIVSGVVPSVVAPPLRAERGWTGVSIKA